MTGLTHEVVSVDGSDESVALRLFAFPDFKCLVEPEVLKHLADHGAQAAQHKPSSRRSDVLVHGYQSSHERAVHRVQLGEVDNDMGRGVVADQAVDDQLDIPRLRGSMGQDDQDRVAARNSSTAPDVAATAGTRGGKPGQRRLVM